MLLNLTFRFYNPHFVRVIKLGKLGKTSHAKFAMARLVSCYLLSIYRVLMLFGVSCGSYYSARHSSPDHIRRIL